MFAPTAQTSLEASAVTPSRPGPHVLATARHAVPSQCSVIARLVLKFEKAPTAQASLREISATARRSLASSEVPALGLGTRVHEVPFQRYVRDALPTKSVRSACPTAHASLDAIPSTPSRTLARPETPATGTVTNDEPFQRSASGPGEAVPTAQTLPP